MARSSPIRSVSKPRRGGITSDLLPPTAAQQSGPHHLSASVVGRAWRWRKRGTRRHRLPGGAVRSGTSTRRSTTRPTAPSVAKYVSSGRCRPAKRMRSPSRATSSTYAGVAPRRSRCRALRLSGLAAARGTRRDERSSSCRARDCAPRRPSSQLRSPTHHASPWTEILELSRTVPASGGGAIKRLGQWLAVWRPAGFRRVSVVS